ncbi:unnamed protein product [marine sediment metagenome]|uniref:ASCH domain-containing protein n=1 Tax=marine sediment metagenome TaxID=412755 RepID=X1MAQ3_9ZZZZ
MRILGFSKKWDKLQQDRFTTFRFARKDKDWSVGELVQIVYKPRSKGGGEKLGIAEILSKEKRAMAWEGDKTGMAVVYDIEAVLDGFQRRGDKLAYFFMWEFLWDCYGGERLMNEPMNKLTLRWVERQ